MPSRSASLYLRIASVLPRRRTAPRVAVRRPHTVSASSLRPAPMRPAIPRISPRLSVKETPCTRSPSAMSLTSSTGSPCAASPCFGG